MKYEKWMIGTPQQQDVDLLRSAGYPYLLSTVLAARGITVNAVAPGFIDTDMTAVLPEKAREAMLSTIPMARPGAPEDVARAVAFLASDEAAYITGQVLAVDGGMAM